jgi:urease accessory protein
MLRALRVDRAGYWPRERSRGTVTLAYDERHRRRIQLASDAGEEFLLDLPRATVLAAGDGLALDDGGWIEVRAAPERLIEVCAIEPELLVRIAWHIGNRHLPAQISSERILLREDAVTIDMVQGLGGIVSRIEAPFTPEGGAYAGDTPDDQRRGGGHVHGH